MTEDDARALQRHIEELKRDLTFELQRRERPDRHPYQVGCLVGLLIVSVAQAIIGLPPESALYGIIGDVTLRSIDGVFITGSTMCLIGAYLSRAKHFDLSLRLGIWGHISIFFACATYSFVVIASTEPQFSSEPYWLAVTSVGLTGGIAYASVMRFRQMRALLKESRHRSRK